MADEKQNGGWQNPQNAPANDSSLQQTGGEGQPSDRLKDGTNDFANGDQEPNSDRSVAPDKSAQTR